MFQEWELYRVGRGQSHFLDFTTHEKLFFSTATQTNCSLKIWLIYVSYCISLKQIELRFTLASVLLTLVSVLLFFFQMKNVDIQGKPLSSRKCTFWDLLPLALLVILSMLLFTCFYETLFWATLRYILEAAEYICLFYTWKWSFRDFVFIASFWFWTSSWREGRNTDLHGHICTRHWLFLWILRKLVECAASISLYDTTWSFFSEAAMRVCMHVWVCVRVC